MGGYFSSVDLEMGVRVRLREVAAYRGLKIQGFIGEIAGSVVRFPFTEDVR